MTEILYLRPEYAPDYVPEPVAPEQFAEPEIPPMEAVRRRYVIVEREPFEELTTLLAKSNLRRIARQEAVEALRYYANCAPL